MKSMCNLNVRLTIIGMFLIAGMITAQPINPNGGFEEGALGVKTGSDIPGWVLFADNGAIGIFELQDIEVHEGTQALSVEANALGSNSWDLQFANDPFDVVGGAEYSYTIWAKADVSGPTVNFTVGDPSYNEWGRLGVVMTTDWQQITITFNASADATVGRAPIHLSATTNTAFLPIVFYFDDLQIVPATVGVEDDTQAPAKFELSQNYPNPFNPETTIDFSVPQKSDIRIELVNTLGQVVKEIVNGNFSAGSHQVKLNASDLSSGIYFYKLIAGNFVDVKKLVLMK